MTFTTLFLTYWIFQCIRGSSGFVSIAPYGSNGFVLAESTDLCRYIVALDCSKEQTTGTLCGQNGVTYSNQWKNTPHVRRSEFSQVWAEPPMWIDGHCLFICEFSKAICSDSSLKLAHTGPCQHEKLQQELVLNYTCADILSMNCSTFRSKPKYCGTDGTTYANVCDFEKARCMNHGIYLNHFGPCLTRQ